MFFRKKSQDVKEIKTGFEFNPAVSIYETDTGFIKVRRHDKPIGKNLIKSYIYADELDPNGRPVSREGRPVTGHMEYEVSKDEACLTDIESNGLGTFLFKSFLDSVSKQKYITTATTALSAISFYEKMGLQVEGHLSGQDKQLIISDAKYIAAGYEFLPMLSGDMKLEKDKFYLREKDGKLVYSVITPRGEPVNDIPIMQKIKLPVDIKTLGDAEKKLILDEASDRTHVSVAHRLVGGRYHDAKGEHEIKGIWESSTATHVDTGELLNFDRMIGTPERCIQTLKQDKRFRANDGWPEVELKNITSIISLRGVVEGYYNAYKNKSS